MIRILFCLLAMLFSNGVWETSTRSDSDLPYLEKIKRADQPIFEGAGYDYCYVGTIENAGAYTIVEEVWDHEGNLWGKLKSGIGWVDLTEIRSEEAAQALITAGFADDTLLNSGNYHEYIAESSEYMVKLAFRAGEVLKNVNFTSLTYDTDSYEIDEILYTLPELTPEIPLVTGVVYYGDMTAYGISFTDKQGEIKYYAAYISGRNGALILDEFTPSIAQ